VLHEPTGKKNPERCRVEIPRIQIILKLHEPAACGFVVDLVAGKAGKAAASHEKLFALEVKHQVKFYLVKKRAHCSGPKGYPYLYGTDFKATKCNNEYSSEYYPLARRPGCVSEFGVFDMVGNIWWEWVRGDNNEPEKAGGPMSRCKYKAPDRGSEKTNGFRCCKSN
jgi:formylglycine-generating enzyme required for sulfatase activity